MIQLKVEFDEYIKEEAALNERIAANQNKKEKECLRMKADFENLELKSQNIDNFSVPDYILINKTHHGILSGTAPGWVVLFINSVVIFHG